MDFHTPEHNRIKVTVKQVYNESGTKVMESEVVGIEGIEWKDFYIIIFVFTISKTIISN